MSYLVNEKYRLDRIGYTKKAPKPMTHGDMKASATSWRRQAERRLRRRRSASWPALSAAVGGRPVTVAMAAGLPELELLGDLLVELDQLRLEVTHLARLVLLGKAAEQVLVGHPDRGDRLEGRLGCWKIFMKVEKCSSALSSGSLSDSTVDGTFRRPLARV